MTGKEQRQIIDAETGLPEPIPPESPKDDPLTASDIPLKTALDVRREQSKVYREARGGKMDRADAAKLIWMLGEIRKSIETYEIEKRLDQLEAAKGLPPPRA